MNTIEIQLKKLKTLPRWLRILLIAVGLVIAAGLILPYFLDVDRYRTLIATAIENETGRKVSIGRVRARLLPHLGFVVEDFRLGNPPGFAEGDVLSAEAIRGNLAWAPLLHREFQLSSIELLRPKLLLLEDERGQTNYSWETPSGPGSRESRRAPGRSSKLASSGGFQIPEIDRIDLTDVEVMLGRVAGRSRTPAASLHARNINAELTHVALDPARLKLWQGDARLDGVQVELPGWKDPIAFRSGRLKLHDGRIDSEFRAAMGKAVEGKGTLRVADIERGVATFEISASHLDFDQLLATQAETTSGPPARPRQSELVAQGRLAAERVLWQPYVANNATAEIRIFTDRVELWPVAVGLYGGTLQISVRVDRTQKPERFSTNVQVRNLDVGKMLAMSPAARGKLSGLGELDLQLFGSLSPDWRKSLSGAGSFAVRDGRLPGINLSGLLESMARLSGVGGETLFSLIRGDLSVKQGRIWSRLIHMDSPRGTVDLRGSCGLEGGLDYEGQAVLVPGANVSAGGEQNPVGAISGMLGGVLQRNVSRATVPFSIRGTLADPKLLPGRGLPNIQGPSPSTQALPEQQPKKSILDIFRRP